MTFFPTVSLRLSLLLPLLDNVTDPENKALQSNYLSQTHLEITDESSNKMSEFEG